jgi:hypothetical protein
MHNPRLPSHPLRRPHFRANSQQHDLHYPPLLGMPVYHLRASQMSNLHPSLTKETKERKHAEAMQQQAT